MSTYKAPIMTPDEYDRFLKVITHLSTERQRVSLVRSIHEFDDPYIKMFHCLYMIGYGVFSHQLVNATLEIYHDAREWLPFLYSFTMVVSGNHTAIIIDDLVASPRDLAAVIMNILVECEGHIRQQIATDFAQQPIDFPHSERVSFLSKRVYQKGLTRFVALNSELATKVLPP